ncbi:xylulokinase [Arthrobacter sp. NIO-1057]|uniref:xylulokinase n=1 Tax=Arthrobacter sp. NIO-1057 TaxID=993071 RepID=UPI00071D308D|nr:xylulokinase [Arthrobacter sp. NIO-1057]KSU65454.1 xylulose kinase [Arthrobacter sp. NIO-1057]SCC35831.1 xylulokinase [Arthrobacter sp. NIO-1057]
MTPTYVLGIDSSTQSCKALLVDAATGEVVAEARQRHPQGTQVDPQHWITAMEAATEELLPRAAAVSIAGQQHGMVALDEHGVPVRDAMLWNDTSSAPQAAELTEELGGAQASAQKIGSVPVASLTVSKLRWLRDHEPHNAQRTTEVLLPHDYLTWHLSGREQAVSDHGDASGTGYYDPAARRFLPELASSALGHPVKLPRLAEANEVVGRTASGAVIAAGTGDNMAAALGLDLQPGDVCISIGTSGVASAVVEHSVHDGTGMVNGFVSANNKYLPLACTLNGAPVLDFGARMLGVGQQEFSDMALAAEPGSGGVVLLPYFGGERTPNRPEATGLLQGLRTTTTREQIARAYVEGLLCSMKDAVAALEANTHQATARILLIGGGAGSEAVRRIAPEVFGVAVEVPRTAEYVALGAARQAAWALSGEDEPPVWNIAASTRYEAQERPEIYAHYASLRDATEGWK